MTGTETKPKRYIALIYTDETADQAQSEKDAQETMAAYFAFTGDARRAGITEGGEALHATSTATTVRVRNGQRQTTDGPFAETKEQLGGYYILKAKDLDEAIEWAARIPGAKRGAVEIRPIVEFDQ